MTETPTGVQELTSSPVLAYRAEIENRVAILREHYADAPWKPTCEDGKTFDLHAARPTLAQLTRKRPSRLWAVAAMVMPQPAARVAAPVIGASPRAKED